MYRDMSVYVDDFNYKNNAAHINIWISELPPDIQTK